MSVAGKCLNPRQMGEERSWSAGFRHFGLGLGVD